MDVFEINIFIGQFNVDYRSWLFFTLPPEGLQINEEKGQMQKIQKLLISYVTYSKKN